MITYSKIFNTIKITIAPLYTKKSCQASPVWAYSIKINNIGNESYRILNNAWHIPNNGGEVDIFDVSNVENFLIKPGQIVEFVDVPPITKNNDIVVGAYLLENEKGELFDIHIPVFSINNDLRTIH